MDDSTFIGTLTKLEVDDTKIIFTIKSKESLICNYYIEKNDEKNYRALFPLGTKLKIVGQLSKPTNNTIPNTFNYKKYLYYKNIYYTCNAESIQILDNNINVLYKIKNFIVNRIMQLDTKDYLYTMIIGDKSLMNENTLDKYKQNGITHLFAISGMHIGFFSSIILYILKKFHIKEYKCYITTITFIWLYAFLTGFSPSVLRACLLFTLLSINKLLNLNIKKLYLLFLTAFTLIIINPFIIKDIGFIYSFITTFGLIYNTNILSKHKIIGTSLVALLYSMPISINSFYSINLLGILFNVIFVPFVSIIIYPFCLITFICSQFEPILKISIYILELLNNIAYNMNTLTFALPKMSFLIIVLYYLILHIGIAKKFYLTSLILIFLVLTNKLVPILNPYYSVLFLDVNQGDSMIIQSPHLKEIIMIDTGGKLNYKNLSSYRFSKNVITYLHSIGVTRIDTLVLTHGDYDHMGEAINLVENFKVEKVIFNCGKFNELELDLIKILDKKKIPYYSCIKELNIDDNKLYFLNNKDYGNENDDSSVIYTELNNHKFLFMGDAGVTTEKEILDKYNLPDIDVLKMGHHGSKTSSSKEFINEINPNYSIISVGKNNRYGHPNKEVLNNLKDSKIYRTDQDGSVMFKIKKNKLQIETCSP